MEEGKRTRDVRRMEEEEEDKEEKLKEVEEYGMEKGGRGERGEGSEKGACIQITPSVVNAFSNAVKYAEIVNVKIILKKADKCKREKCR